MAGVRTGIDVGRLAEATKRPGIDPRVWLTLAIVKDVGFDADEGVFVDLQYQPSGELETALLGTYHAGGGFGAYHPVKIDDTVLVAVPMGDPGHGPIIICRMWNAGDPPPADIGDGEEVVSDTVLRTEDGTSYKVLAKNGNISLQAEDGLVELSKLGASQSFVRGDDFTDAFGKFLTAFNTFMTSVSGATTAAQIATAATTFQADPQAGPAPASKLNLAKSSYLSSKVKGE